MVLRKLLLVVIDPKEVKNFIAGPGGDVCLEDRNICLPKHMHQVCTYTAYNCQGFIVDTKTKCVIDFAGIVVLSIAA
jgi:hypothetical protein